MSNLIYIGDRDPVNLACVESISQDDSWIDFRFQMLAITWHFNDERKAKIVYEAILRSRCRNIGECELTAEEIGEIENGCK